MPRPTNDAATPRDTDAGRHTVLSDRQAAGVTPAELQEVLLQQGYSADRRNQRLKEMLTDLTEGDAARTPEQRRMIETIREILGETQGAPKADVDRA